LRATRHSAANSGLRQEVTSRHARKNSLSPELTPSLESLLRKVLAQASSEAETSSQPLSDDKIHIIVDTEVDGVRCLLTRQEKPKASHVSFSPRESEIARMVAKGYPNKAIAAVLEISPWTVCTHLRRIFAKLHVSSRAAMVAQLISGGVFKDIP